MRKLALISFLGQAIGFLIYYLTSFILVRIISPNDYGVFQKFNLLLTTTIPLIGFTLVSSLYYFYPLAKEYEKGKVIVQTYVLLSIIGFIFIVLFSLNKALFLNLFNLNLPFLQSSWIFLSVPFYLVSSISDNLFLLNKRQLVMILYLPIEKSLFFICVLVSYYTSKSLDNIFYGILVYSIAKVSFVSFYIFRLYGFKYISIDKKYVYSQLKYCVPFYIANIAYTLSAKFDKIYINNYITAEEYAYYSISFMSIPLLTNAFSSINSVSLPELTNYLRDNDFESVKRLYRNIVTKTSSLALPFLVFFIMNSREIITLLFTEKYLSALMYYRIYLLSFLVSLTSYGLILRASNRTNLIFIVNVSSSIITVLFGLYIIPIYGLYGAISTALVSVTLPGIIQLLAEIKTLKFTFFDFFPIRNFFSILLISLASIPASLTLKYVLNIHGLFYLILSAFLYFGITLVLLYIMKLLPFQDKLKKFFPNILFLQQ